jgi:BirA family biotin operon repressor/biotin-[acetyl-CoA-carboxylase] ligase
MTAAAGPSTLPEEFADPLGRAADRLGAFGRRVVWYESVPSTNTVAASLAEHGAEEGCVVVADAQSAGRGRLGRSWSSPPGAGIYASIVVRPGAAVAPLITLASGVAIAEGIQAAAGLEPEVKWPNDIYVRDRKLAGILAEAGASAAGGHVVVGFGINVRPGSYPPDVAARATSIESELGRPVDRGLVFAECLAAMAERYRALGERRGDEMLAAWRRRARATFGRGVEWVADGDTQQGIVQDVDDSGALVVRTTRGVARVVAGEMKWI